MSLVSGMSRKEVVSLLALKNWKRCFTKVKIKIFLLYMKLCQVEAGQEEDTACEKFRLRVARASDQVIRYLWDLKFSDCSFK